MVRKAMAGRRGRLMGEDWAKLFSMACGLIDQVNAQFSIIDEWSLGGGTALMLQIGHRQSHDVDIFIQDPQLLSFLDPAKADLKFEIMTSIYSGDGMSFRKFAFPGLGEIDFIVGRQLTAQPFLKAEIDDRSVLLETIGEIVAKKVFYRGASLAPRDIFDIAAAAEQFRTEIEKALSGYPERVGRALTAMEQQNRLYIDAVIDDLQIMPSFEHLKGSAVEVAREVLQAALSQTHP